MIHDVTDAPRFARLRQWFGATVRRNCCAREFERSARPNRRAGRTAPNIRVGCRRCRVLLRRAGRRCWIGREAAPHHDIGLIVLDWLPRSKHSFALVAAPFGDPLRGRVVKVGDELGSDDVEFVEGPTRRYVERLGRKPLATNSTVEPIERLGSSGTVFEMNADLSDASVLRWDRDRKAEQPMSPEFESAFNPLAGVTRCHGFRHEREARNVRVLARRRDVIGVGDSEWSQNKPSTALQDLGTTQLNHDTSLVDTVIGMHRDSFCDQQTCLVMRVTTL